MSTEDEAFLMSSEIEDDLVIEEEIEEELTTSDASTSTSGGANPEDIETEMNRILNTPWYELTQDQAEIIHRLVAMSSNEQMGQVDLRNSIENSLMELAMIRGRNSEVSQQH